MVSKLATETWPWMQQFYFPLAVVLAFLGTFILGYLVEMLLIRRLYARPLDTLLATWGLGPLFRVALRDWPTAFAQPTSLLLG